MKITLNIPTVVENDNQLNDIQREIDHARRELHEAMKRKGPIAKVGAVYRSATGRLWAITDVARPTAAVLLCIQNGEHGAYWTQGSTLTASLTEGRLFTDWTETVIQTTVDIPS